MPSPNVLLFCVAVKSTGAMSYLDPNVGPRDAEATIAARERFLPGTEARKAKSASAAVPDEARRSPAGDRREAAAAFAESALEASAYIEVVVKVFCGEGSHEEGARRSAS